MHEVGQVLQPPVQPDPVQTEEISISLVPGSYYDWSEKGHSNELLLCTNSGVVDYPKIFVVVVVVGWVFA